MSIVLVVEDSATDFQILSSFLQKVGISVVSAKSADEAQQKLAQSQPDLIILDVILPDQSGFELCRTIKNNPATSKIPVIMSSTKDTDVDKMWGNMLGADAYIPKPINEDEMLQTIQKLLNK
jgi:two-component system, chemotaxis family, response regulator PixH